MDLLGLIKLGLLGSFLLLSAIAFVIVLYNNQKERTRKQKEFVDNFMNKYKDVIYIEDVLKSFHKEFNKLDIETQDFILVNELWYKTLVKFYKSK